MIRRRLGVLATAMVTVLLAVACGAPKSGKFSEIPLGNLPDGLTATTAAPTTTTIVATTSTFEPISTTTTIEAVPTTTNPTELVTLYFVSEAGSQLVSSPRYLPSPPQELLVLLALKEPPDGGNSGLRTAIPSDAAFSRSSFRGVFTVDLSPNFFTSMASPADERLAIAQIVLTLTQLRGISTVRFTMDNEPIAVKLGTGEPSDVGQLLVAEDYEVLTGNVPPPLSTTTTTVPDSSTTVLAEGEPGVEGAAEPTTTLTG